MFLIDAFLVLITLFLCGVLLAQLVFVLVTCWRDVLYVLCYPLDRLHKTILRGQPKPPLWLEILAMLSCKTLVASIFGGAALWLSESAKTAAIMAAFGFFLA